MTSSRPIIEAAGDKAAYIEAKGDLHGRAIREWVGATPDTPVPDKVTLRVLLRQSRRDAITGQRIRPGDATRTDHIVSLKQGGPNRESNLQVILDDTHKEKTGKENTENAKVERLQRKHYGLQRSRYRWPKRGLGRKWA